MVLKPGCPLAPVTSRKATETMGPEFRKQTGTRGRRHEPVPRPLRCMVTWLSPHHIASKRQAGLAPVPPDAESRGLSGDLGSDRLDRHHGPGGRFSPLPLSHEAAQAAVKRRSLRNWVEQRGHDAVTHCP